MIEMKMSAVRREMIMTSGRRCSYVSERDETKKWGNIMSETNE